MGGLILLVILAILVFIAIPLSILVKAGEQRRLLESLYDNLKDLNAEVKTLSKALQKDKTEIPAGPVFKAEPGKQVIKETTLTDQLNELTKNAELEEKKKEIKEEVLSIQAAIEVPPIHPIKKNPDLEKFIGENVANKIGIAVLVLGISFFVKYAIDKNWLQETGRVIVGLICGSVLIGLAHRLRNRYRAFSSVLVGGGLTVFYFTIAFAFHQYHLIGQTAAFIFMVIVSAFAVLLSILYNRQELAILATIGGFITPFLVNTSQENHVALFTYLCILNTGLIALSWFKRWPAINMIALFFTTVIYGSWLIEHLYYEDISNLPFNDAFLFLALFYLLFIVMNIINCVRLKKEFSWLDFIALFSVNFLFYAAGMVLLETGSLGNLQGLFTASLGFFNLILTAIFYKHKKTDRNFVSLLMGLSLSFISMFAPVELKGNYITLFWAAEAIVLLLLYQRSKIRLLKIVSLIVAVLMTISLVFIWSKVYLNNKEIMPVIINKGFITAICAAACLFVYKNLLKKQGEQNFTNGFSTLLVRNIMTVLTVIILYFLGVLEIDYQFKTRYLPVSVINVQAYTCVFVAILLGIFRNIRAFSLMKLLLTAFCFILYLVNINSTCNISESLLISESGKGFFIAHWVSAAVLLCLLIDCARSLYRKAEIFQSYKPGLTWLIMAAITLLLSIELYQIMLWINHSVQVERLWWENLYYKAGLSILWSISSFVMIWLGMKYRFRTLRIIALTLFSISLVKLFIYDIRNIPPGGKIAAFILLGCLLLIVSFMYQRLKKIIFGDAGEISNDNHDSLQHHY